MNNTRMSPAASKLQSLIERMKSDLEKYIATGKASPQAVMVRKATINEIIQYFNGIENHIQHLEKENNRMSNLLSQPYIIDIRKRYQRQRPVTDHTGIDDLITLSEHAQTEANQLYDLAITLKEKNLTWYDRTHHNNHRTATSPK